MKQKGTTWIDYRGREIPSYAVSAVVKLEDKHSAIMEKAALKAEKALLEVVEAARKSYDEIYAAKCRDAEVFAKAAPGDSMTFRAFDGSVEVRITKPETLYFDDTYTSLVKEKFAEYFASLEGDETVLFLRDLVDSLLFSPRGRLDMSKVLSLRQYRDRLINSPRLAGKGKNFIEAMDIFDRAIRRKPGSPGIYIDRIDGEGKRRRIPLKYTDLQGGYGNELQ